MSRPGAARAAAAVLLLFTFHLFVLDAHERVLLDFSYFFEAGVRLAAGEDIYLKPYLKLDRDETIKELYYFYPPLLAYFLSFFAGLEYEAAKLWWCLLNYAAFVCAATGLTKLWGQFNLPLPEQWRFPAILFFLTCFEPLYWAVSLGQIDVIVMALLIAFLWMISANRNRLAGAALAIAILLKISPALLIIPVLRFRRFSVLWSAAAVMAAFTVLLIMTVERAAYINFATALQQVSSGNLTSWYSDNLSIDKALAQIFGAWVWDYRFVVKAAFLLVGAMLLPVFNANRTSELRCYAAFMVLMIILSPAIWFQHLLWAVPALFLVTVSAPRSKELLPKHLTGSTAVYFIMTQLQLMRVKTRAAAPQWLPFVSVLPTLLLLYLVWMVLKSDEHSAEEAHAAG